MAVNEVVTAYEDMSETERREFRASVGVQLPAPSGPALGAVWVLLIVILGIVVVGGGFLTYLLVNSGKSAEVLVAFVSGALGGLLGLLAPAPTKPDA